MRQKKVSNCERALLLGLMPPALLFVERVVRDVFFLLPRNSE
jgi:hypothetical protein